MTHIGSRACAHTRQFPDFTLLRRTSAVMPLPPRHSAEGTVQSLPAKEVNRSCQLAPWKFSPHLKCNKHPTQNYISAIEEEEELSAEKKYRILLHCLGPGGLKIFKNINKKPRQAGDGDLYKNALEDLDNYYRPRVCIAVDHYTFFHRKQGKEEPVEDYVSALKNLAINCRFGDLHDELIRDQIVMQSSNSNVQDNLWAKGESSLQEVIDIVKRAELTGRCAKEVLNENKREETIIARVKEKKKTKDFKKRSTGRTGIESKNFKPDDKKKCYRCGSYDHLANDKLCPAKKQKCLKCGIVGHFQKVCQRKNGGSKILDLEDKLF
ncbi:hypothetical protein NDU88_006516 [Pleurodeles waltl]|uniref:CCHC-type domain-containing protein n=1 Tax=Pleurodeles waltl TaxID=8319 RepID=A0AAV7WYG9_PLEWA|nr:hypothetical protein NDU88_006516 [Pleurodeles waltl]